MSSIKFYSNYKDGKVFISGQNEKKVWLSLWKSTEFNKDLYLDNDKFKGGCEIEKSLLRLHDEKPGCRVLVFKDAEEEAKFCITKEEVEKRKSQRKSKTKLISSVFDYIDDIVKDLVEANDLKFEKDGLVSTIIFKKDEALEVIEEDDEELPF